MAYSLKLLDVLDVQWIRGVRNRDYVLLFSTMVPVISLKPIAKLRGSIGFILAFMEDMTKKFSGKVCRPLLDILMNRKKLIDF